MSRIEFYGRSPYGDPSKTMVDQTTGEHVPFLGELLPGDKIELIFSEGKVLVEAEKKKSKKPLKFTVTFQGKVIKKSEIADFTAKGIMLGESEGQDSVFSGMVLPLIHFVMYCKL